MGGAWSLTLGAALEDDGSRQQCAPWRYRKGARMCEDAAEAELLPPWLLLALLLEEVQGRAPEQKGPEGREAGALGRHGEGVGAKAK